MAVEAILPPALAADVDCRLPAWRRVVGRTLKSPQRAPCAEVHRRPVDRRRRRGQVVEVRDGQRLERAVARQIEEGEDVAEQALRRLLLGDLPVPVAVVRGYDFPEGLEPDGVLDDSKEIAATSGGTGTVRASRMRQTVAPGWVGRHVLERSSGFARC